MRYPGAVWKGPVPNTYGPSVALRPRLIVAHVTQGGDLDGTDSWFHNPDAEVSAHFGVKRDGTVYQWVDTAEVAWAECSYNNVALSIEHEGWSGTALTPQQLQATHELMRWLSKMHGVPLHRTADPSGSGVIGHGELGIAGCDHPDCPGAPILHQLSSALAQPNLPAPAKRKEPPVTTTPREPIIPKDPANTTQSKASLARQGAAIAAIVTSLTHTLPANLRSWGFVIGGLLLIVEHYVGDTSTGTPS